MLWHGGHFHNHRWCSPAARCVLPGRNDHSDTNGSGSTVVCAGGQGNGDSKHDESFSFATDVFVLNVDGSLASHNASHALSVGRKKLSAAATGWLRSRRQ